MCKKRVYARFACGNPHFHTSWYKISYDTRAKNVFLASMITSLAFGSWCTHTRQKSFHRTRIVMYYFSYIFVPPKYSHVNIKVVSALVPEWIFFQGKLSISVAKNSRNGRSRSEILRFIFFSTHDYSPGVHPGQYKSLFSCNKYIERTVPKRNHAVYIFFLTHMFVPEGYILVNIKVISAFVPRRIFFFFFFLKKSNLFQLLRNHRTDAPGAKFRGLYF